MKTFLKTRGLSVPRGAPIALLLALTALIFFLASKIEDGWLVKAVMGTSLLLLACLLPRFRQEERERRHAIRFNTALSASRVALWIYDFKKGTIEWTDSIDSITGHPAGGFPRTIKGWLGSIHPEDMDLVRAELEDCRLSGNQFSAEYRIQNRTGVFMWVSDIGDVLVKNERASTMHGSIRDITERKRSTERSSQLLAQLRQAQKSEAIGTLAGGIAHDFNNLLTGIIGSSELILQDMDSNGDGQHYRAFVETIRRTGGRAAALVHQILQFSRKSEKCLHALSVPDIVAEVLALLRSTVPANIEIEHFVSPNMPQIIGDETQIHQLLVNLCTNGVHAMKGTNGHLVVTLDAVEADLNFIEEHPDILPGLKVHISVSDTGHGMDTSTVKKIFEPFFTTKGPTEGTGLGLAIVHGIVKEHSGGIYCTSQLGEGTTFDVYIPACTGNTEFRSETERVAHLITKHEHILVIDNEPDMLKTTAEMLRRLGYNVHAVSGSEAAVQVFRTNPAGFDLVLTDMEMKGGTGLELAQRLLRIHSYTPIVIMTGFAGQLTEKSLRSAGISGLITKPFSTDELGDAIRRFIDQPAKIGTED